MMIGINKRALLCAIFLIYGLLPRSCAAFDQPDNAQYVPYENIALMKVLDFEQRPKGLVYLSFEVLDQVRGNWKNGQIVRVYFFDETKRVLVTPKDSVAVLFLNYCDQRQMQPVLEQHGKKFERVQLPFLQKEVVNFKKLKSLLSISPYHKEIVMNATLLGAVPKDGGKKVRLSVCNLSLLHGKVDNLPSAALFDLPASQVSGFTKLPISSSRKLFVILEARNVWTTPKSQLVMLEEGTIELVPKAEIFARSEQLQLSQKARESEKEKLIEFLLRTWTAEKIALYCSPYSADLPNDQVYTGFGYDNVWSGQLYSYLQHSLGKVDWKCGLVHHRPDGCVIEVEKSGMRWTIPVDLSSYLLTEEEVYRMRIISTLRRWSLKSMQRAASSSIPMVSFDSRVALERTASAITGAVIEDSKVGRIYLKLGSDLQIESVQFQNPL